MYSADGLVYARFGRSEEAVRAGKRGMEMLPVEMEAWRGSFRIIDLAVISMLVGDQNNSLDLPERLLSMPSKISQNSTRIDPL